jgi:hypothetical protein
MMYSSPTREVLADLSRPLAVEIGTALKLGRGRFEAKRGLEPGPYGTYLYALEISEKPTGKVTMSLDADNRVLHLSGAREHLTVLGGALIGLAGDPDPLGHLHVDYFEDHYYLAESELSIVFQIEEAD